MAARSLRPPPHLCKPQSNIVTETLVSPEEGSIKVKLGRFKGTALTALRRENRMRSRWGKSCRVKVFTRVGSHLKEYNA